MRRDKSDFVSMRYSVEKLPRGGVSKRTFYETLIRAVHSGSGELPEDWEITWCWRNAPEREEVHASFAEAVQGSRAGFLVLMENRLRRDLAKIAPEAEPEIPPIREAEPKEVAAIEEAEAEAEEDQAERNIEERRKARKREAATRRREALGKRKEFLKRSAAAKKGWQTRRRREREKAEAAEQRRKARKKIGRKR